MDPDVVQYIKDIRDGTATKNALLDFRKWMAGLYYGNIDNVEKT